MKKEQDNDNDDEEAGAKEESEEISQEAGAKEEEAGAKKKKIIEFDLGNFDETKTVYQVDLSGLNAKTIEWLSQLQAPSRKKKK